MTNNRDRQLEYLRNLKFTADELETTKGAKGAATAAERFAGNRSARSALNEVSRRRTEAAAAAKRERDRQRDELDDDPDAA